MVAKKKGPSAHHAKKAVLGDNFDMDLEFLGKAQVPIDRTAAFLAAEHMEDRLDIESRLKPGGDLHEEYVKYRRAGQARLQYAQYEQAMDGTAAGAKMLQWLGVQYLGQTTGGLDPKELAKAKQAMAAVPEKHKRLLTDVMKGDIPEAIAAAIDNQYADKI